MEHRSIVKRVFRCPFFRLWRRHGSSSGKSPSKRCRCFGPQAMPDQNFWRTRFMTLIYSHCFMTDPNEEEVFYEKGKTIAKAGIDDKLNPSEQTIPNPRECLDCVWPCVSNAIMVECEWWPLGTSWFINQLCRLHIQLIDDNGFAWSIIGRSVGRIGSVPSLDDKCGTLNHSKPISTDGQRWVIGCGFGIYRFTRKV